LGWNQITNIPNEIGNLKKLELLFLDHNNINNVPKNIGNIINLKELDLSENNLTSYPKAIGNLKNIERLYLNGNPIDEAIPKSYNNFKKIEIFEYSHWNECQKFEFFMNNLNINGGIFECNEKGKLIIINLDIEKITIPQKVIDQIGKYKNLKKLTIHASFKGEIYNFDAIKHLSSLTDLDIDNGIFNKDRTQLRDNFFPTGICKATNLEKIKFIGFNFNSFPKSISDLKKLKYLNLSNNEIKAIPNRIGDLEKLEILIYLITE